MEFEEQPIMGNAMKQTCFQQAYKWGSRKAVSRQGWALINIAGLCNGSTADFDSVSGSSNLSLAAKVKKRKFDFSQNF